MDTLEEVKEQYEVNEYGNIIDPGKFEGSPWWIIPLWELTLISGEDAIIYDGDTPTSCFKVTEKEVREYDLEPKRIDSWVCLWESEQGFVFYEFTNNLDEFIV